MENKLTNIKDRVLQFAKYQGVSVEKFLNEINMTYGSFKGKAKDGALNSNAIEKIYTNYPEINLDWLIAGEGEMLKQKQQFEVSSNTKSNNNVLVAEIIKTQMQLVDMIKTTQFQISKSQQQIEKFQADNLELIKMLSKDFTEN